MREHTAEHIMAPMGPESVILVDELILHNEKAPGRATQVDMVTMSALAGSERQWEELSEKVGLRVLGLELRGGDGGQRGDRATKLFFYQLVP